MGVRDQPGPHTFPYFISSNLSHSFSENLNVSKQGYHTRSDVVGACYLLFSRLWFLFTTDICSTVLQTLFGFPVWRTCLTQWLSLLRCTEKTQTHTHTQRGGEDGDAVRCGSYLTTHLQGKLSSKMTVRSYLRAPCFKQNCDHWVSLFSYVRDKNYSSSPTAANCLLVAHWNRRTPGLPADIFLWFCAAVWELLDSLPKLWQAVRCPRSRQSMFMMMVAEQISGGNTRWVQISRIYLGCEDEHLCLKTSHETKPCDTDLGLSQ